MKCPSGKRSYETPEEAEEALIGTRINFHHENTSGPINIYKCEDCGEWHLTSRGTVNELLQSDEVLRKIKLERESREWERRLR